MKAGRCEAVHSPPPYRPLGYRGGLSAGGAATDSGRHDGSDDDVAEPHRVRVGTATPDDDRHLVGGDCRAQGLGRGRRPSARGRGPRSVSYSVAPLRGRGSHASGIRTLEAVASAKPVRRYRESVSPPPREGAPGPLLIDTPVGGASALRSEGASTRRMRRTRSARTGRPASSRSIRSPASAPDPRTPR